MRAHADRPIALVVGDAEVGVGDRSFRPLLFEVIERSPGCSIHLDMTAVTSLDSGTLGTLIAAYKRANELGGDVCIVGASAKVRAVLAVTGTSEILLADGGDADG
jgi:anti-anti-sigma factor